MNPSQDDTRMRYPTRTVTALLIAAAPLAAQGAAADPEIYLLRLSVANGRVSVDSPTNITMRKGYDNQPSFTPNGRSLYFTSTHEDAQADIYRYDLTTKKTDRITTTAPESEYSATVVPGGNRISVIRVEKDSTQRLWSFTLSGKDPQIVLTDIKPVGYHTWIDSTHLALFVLGQPNSLVLANTRTGKSEVVAHDVGRSLLPVPGDEGFSYLAHVGKDWVFTEVMLSGNHDHVSYIKPVVTLPAGMDYVARVAGGLIGGTGSKLYTWREGGQWTEIADFASAGLTKISRIAVSPTGTLLAIVAEPH
ncbi:MAG TPA: hypothetical protein VIV65_08190 [Gemmatimonadaceae bacterium]